MLGACSQLCSNLSIEHSGYFVQVRKWFAFAKNWDAFVIGLLEGRMVDKQYISVS